MRPKILRLPISHYCHKVDWALRDHGLQADQCVIWFRDLADITQINPDNTVPVLELEDHLVCGSQAILQWLANEVETGSTLYPSEAVAQWESWADEVIGPLARRDAYRTLYEKPTRYTSNPLVWLVGVFAKPLILNILKAYKARRDYDKDDIERPTVFSKIANQVRANGPFLFGAQKTAADYATAALLEPILRIRKPSQIHPDWNFLKAYVKAVKPRGSPYIAKEKFTPQVRARLERKAG